jgi:hypothetical protein
MREITVAALHDFWTVRCDGVQNEMLFPTGGKAEDAARRLAGSLAAAGETALRTTPRNERRVQAPLACGCTVRTEAYGGWSHSTPTLRFTHFTLPGVR